MNGRLLPFGWAKFLWYRRKIDGCRVFALGVKPEYQDLGIAAAFYIEHIEQADPEQKQIWWGEMGWILETNERHEPGDGGDGRQDRASATGSSSRSSRSAGARVRRAS